jgi:hypothetical protein
MRIGKRPRKYVGRVRLALLLPLFRYSTTRDAYVLRIIGGRKGPVLLLNRRVVVGRRHRFEGVDRRREAQEARAA